jgi:hypothetical protein
VSNITNAIKISANENHSVALLNDGTVKAWGRNDYGQLGNGNATDSNTPIDVSNITNINKISSGGNHSLALLNDGTLKSWGRNNHNQLGDTTFNDSEKQPTEPNITFSRNQEINYYTSVVIGEKEVSNTEYALKVNGNTKIIGDLFAYSFSETSDRRLKNNISSLASQPDTVENFKLLRPVQYNLIERPDRSSMGLIAQEVEELFPELVSTDSRGFKSVNYTSFTALCINQIQKQESELQSLRERLDKLEEK